MHGLAVGLLPGVIPAETGPLDQQLPERASGVLVAALLLVIKSKLDVIGRSLCQASDLVSGGRYASISDEFDLYWVCRHSCA